MDRPPPSSGLARPSMAGASSSPAKIVLVDAEKLRSQSIELQEFTSFATHIDFPHVIPKGEIWIDKNATETDRAYFAIDGQACEEAAKQGMDEDEAYDYGVSADRSEREKQTVGGEGNYPLHEDVSPDIYIDLIGVWKGKGEEVGIWLVDGQKVRETLKTDYGEGGHGFVYSFIPEDEIWIEQMVAESEWDKTITHELTERNLMKHEDVGYNDAHDYAAKIEWNLRKKEKQQVKNFNSAVPDHEISNTQDELIEGEIKTMSAMGETTGGALVSPAKQKKPKSLVFDPMGLKTMREKWQPTTVGFKAGPPLRGTRRSTFSGIAPRGDFVHRQPPIPQARVGKKSYEDDPQRPRFAAIDFDGTIAEIHPNLHYDLEETKPRKGAKEGLERLWDENIRIIIWTVRDDLEDVADWMDEHGLPYDEINANPFQQSTSRKIMADVYVDDRGITAKQSWPEIVDDVLKAVKKERKKRTEHVVIVGHSGAGKTTLAKLLNAKTGMPTINIDEDSIWEESGEIKDHPERYEIGSHANKKFRKLLKKLARKSLKTQEPSIIEGCQLLVRPGTLRGHHIILIDADEETVVRQRLQRDAGLGKLKSDGSNLKQREEKARFLFKQLKPFVDKMREMPDVTVITPSGMREFVEGYDYTPKVNKPMESRWEHYEKHIGDLDPQGGKKPVIDPRKLEEADFITLPLEITGTNCGNCMFNIQGSCDFPSLRGQPVNERNCCAKWDSKDTKRYWDNISGNKPPEGS